MLANFREYIVIGGMPAIVNQFVTNNNYSGTLKMQRQILLDYEEDITKYAHGLDKGKILNIYRKIPVFLGKENKKFQKYQKMQETGIISALLNGSTMQELSIYATVWTFPNCP